MPKRINRKKEAAWNLGFAYGILGFNILTGIVLVPVYLRYIDQSLYGAWLATGNVLAWFTLFDPGLGRVLTQKIAQAYGAQQLHKVGSLIFPGFVFAVGLGILIIIVGQLLAPYVPRVVSLSDPSLARELETAFRVAIFGVGLTIFSFAPASINRGLMRAAQMGLAGFLGMTGYVITILICIYSGLGIYSLAIALISRSAITGILNLSFMIHTLVMARIPVPFSMANSRQLMSASLFTFLSRSATRLSRNSDALLVSALFGPAVVTPFELTKRGLSFATSILQRPSNALTSSISHLHGENDSEKMLEVMQRALRVLLFFSMLAAFAFLSLNGEFVRIWVGADLYAGELINLFFVLSFLAIIARTICVDLTMALGDFRAIGTIGIIEGFIYVPLAILLASRFGLTGIAATAAMTFFAIVGWFYGRAFLRRLRVAASDFALLLRTLAASLPAGILAWGATQAFIADSFLVFAFKTVLFVSVFVTTSLLLDPRLRADVTEVLNQLPLARRLGRGKL